MSKLISIVCPSFQSSIFIGDSINSVLNQTYTNWELIIIDDGSTDDTKELVDKYIKIDNRIKYFYQENGKQGRARNRGIKESLGHYLAFLDADDWWDSQFLQKSIEVLEFTQCEMICSRAKIYSENEKKIVGIKDYVKDEILQGKLGISKLAQGNLIPMPTVIIKKDCLYKVGYFDESLSIWKAEDYDLWIRVLIGGFKVKSAEFNFSYYRIHESNSTKLDTVALIPTLHVIAKNKYLIKELCENWKQIQRIWIKRALDKSRNQILFNIRVLSKIVDNNCQLVFLLIAILLPKKTRCHKKLVKFILRF